MNEWKNAQSTMLEAQEQSGNKNRCQRGLIRDRMAGVSQRTSNLKTIEGEELLHAIEFGSPYTEAYKIADMVRAPTSG